MFTAHIRKLLYKLHAAVSNIVLKKLQIPKQRNAHKHYTTIYSAVKFGNIACNAYTHM